MLWILQGHIQGHIEIIHRATFCINLEIYATVIYCKYGGCNREKKRAKF